jgi:hypothetical protein
MESCKHGLSCKEDVEKNRYKDVIREEAKELRKRFSEPPKPHAAQRRDRQIVVPAKQIDGLAGARDEAGPERHDAQREVARNRALRD